MLELVKSTHPALTKTADTIPEVTDAIRELAADMLALMHSSRGIGLAAPQVGHSIRMFVVNVGDGYDRVCINPSIIEYSSETSSAMEGCLSFPGVMVNVTRPITIVAQYTNLEGKTVTRQLDGLAARCYQHELDHLLGKCIVDSTSGLKRELLRKKLRKLTNVSSSTQV